MSHSSRSQSRASSELVVDTDCSAHQSPDEYHGPADHRIFPSRSLRSASGVIIASLQGRLFAICTQIGRDGRKMRNATGGTSKVSDNVSSRFPLLGSSWET